MVRDPLLTVESKITILFMFLGLTAWYLTQTFVDNEIS